MCTYKLCIISNYIVLYITQLVQACYLFSQITLCKLYDGSHCGLFVLDSSSGKNTEASCFFDQFELSVPMQDVSTLPTMICDSLLLNFTIYILNVQVVL